MKKFFLGLMISLMICGVSSADILYTTTSGNMGLIEIASSRDISAPSVKYSGVGESPFVAPYWNGDNSCVIVIDRTTDIINTSGDSALIFYGSDLTTPIFSEPRTLIGSYYTTGASFSMNGRSVFLSSYSNGTIKEFSTQDLSEGHSYTYTPNASEDIYTPHALGVRTDYTYVYGLINASPTQSYYFRFDGQLRSNTELFAQYAINSETSSMSVLNNGQSIFSCPDGVRALNNQSVSILLSTDYPVVSICPDTGSGFYFIMQSLSDDVSIDILAHYSIDDASLTYMQEIQSGSYHAIVKDTDHNILAVITGEEIFMFSMNNDVLVAEYGSAELGGEPVSIAMNGAGGYSKDKSNSNCEISGAGIILLALCVKKFLRRK